ncbi:MAG: hypothetical protein IJR70_03715 [Eubacterium sp.]|nr:hypothetical protein [Eubacterium sp.]
MNTLFIRLKNLPFYLCPAFIFTAGTMIFINLLTLIPSENMNALYDGLHSGITALFAFSGATFIIYFICKNTKKAVAAGYCVLLFDAVIYSICKVHISFVFVVILSLIFSFFFERGSLLAAFSVCSLISVITALSIGISYEYLFELLKAFCSSLKGKGALFGIINNAYSLLFSDNLSKLFYHKDYSGTAFVNSEIVTGVIDIFKAQKVAGIGVSKYMTGKYFVNIFVSSGLFLLLYQRFEKEQKMAFLLCFAIAVVFGDVRLFALFLLLYNPLMYLGYLFLIAVSYLSSYLLDIRIVFLKSGSLIELFRYLNKPVYFILAGLVITALTYFSESIILSKFDFQNRRIFPYGVKKLIAALGGERNIERIKENELTVRNPNLINILALDCEIKGNTVTLYPDDISALKPFFE